MASDAARQVGSLRVSCRRGDPMMSPSALKRTVTRITSSSIPGMSQFRFQFGVTWPPKAASCGPVAREAVPAPC